MKAYFFNRVYLLMRILVLVCLVGCGSVQNINGVNVRQPVKSREVMTHVFVGVTFFCAGYNFQKDYFNKKK